MKAIFAVALIALISVSSATSLAELDRTPYGKSLIDSAFLSMQLGDPASKIVETLQDEAKKINAQQDQMDADHAEFQKACEEDKAEYRANIAQAESDIKENTQALAKAEAEEKRLSGELEETQNNLRDTQATLKSETEAYNAFKAQNEGRRKELREAIALFQKAKDAFQAGFQGSFLQTNSASHLANQMKEAKVPTTYRPYLKLLIQALESPYSTKVVNNQDAASSIVSLFDRLLENSQAQLDELRAVFEKTTNAWNARKANLEAKIQRLTSRVAQLTQELAAVRSAIQTYKANLADAQERLANNTKKLQERTAECDAEQAKYERDTAENNKYLEAIAEVVKIFQERIVDFTKYINETRDNVNIQ